jgi:hypothetical protein
MVAGALNHRAVTDTIGHPLGFIAHIMALSRRMNTDFLRSARTAPAFLNERVSFNP